MELRSAFHRDLHTIDQQVRQLFAWAERSGHLAQHIAPRAARGLSRELTPPVPGLIQEMGRVGVELWRQTARAYTTREAGAGERLRDLDDELGDHAVNIAARVQYAATGGF